MLPSLFKTYGFPARIPWSILIPFTRILVVGEFLFDKYIDTSDCIYRFFKAFKIYTSVVVDRYVNVRLNNLSEKSNTSTNPITLSRIPILFAKAVDTIYLGIV